MIDFNLQTVAAGGLIALVAGFWNQTKAILRQVSSVLIVQARLDWEMIYLVRRHLKRHYRKVPTGVWRYHIHWAQKPGSGAFRVPFRTHLTSILFFRWCEVVLFQGETLYGIRFLCNFDALVDRAIDEIAAEDASVMKNIRRKRFHIYQIIGSEKYLSGTSLRGNRSDPAAPPVGEKAADGDSASSASYLDLGLDQSFKYPNEDDYMNLDTDAPFMSLYYPPEVQKHIDHARQWMNAQDWYATRDIPWRLGWLLEGPPGTGKSSLVRAVGQTLGLPIYDFKLGTLSDQEFIENWRGLSTPCIVLFEDIDNVFDKRESLTDHRSLSFDTVLNTISGVNLVNGVFLIVTTNHLEKIDPALGVNDANTPKMSTRPGRVDVVIRLGNLDEAGRYQVARRILQDWPITIAGLVNENTNVTPAQFQELCVEAAFQQMQADRDRREREIVLGAIGGSQTVGQQTRTEGATYSL